MHFKGCRNGFDKNGGVDAAPFQPEFVFAIRKNFRPQLGLIVVFQLGQTEPDRAVTFNQFFGVVKKIQTKIDKGSRDRFAIDEYIPFEQMPASRTKNDLQWQR